MGTHPIFESDFDCLTDFVKMVKIVESQADFDAVINGSTLVCVDFFATWCGPCKMIAPKLEAMSKEMEGKVIFLKVDVDELEDLAAAQKSRLCQLLHFSKVERNSNLSLEPMKLEFVRRLKNCWVHKNHKCSLHVVSASSLSTQV